MSTDTVVIKNVRGYTWRDGKLHRFNGLCFRGDSVVDIAQDGKRLRENYKVDREIDGEGKVMLPGLIDAHGHVLELGYARLNVDLSGAGSVEEVKRRVDEHARAHSNLEWIEGFGWDESQWEDDRFPSAGVIDEVVSERPVWLVRKDSHAGWANTEALRRAGVTASTSAPGGGRIVRSNGSPTGIMIDQAMKLVERKIPDRDKKKDQNALQEAQKRFRSAGLTTVHDACMDQRRYELFHRAAREGNLTTRIYGMIDGRSPFYGDWLDHGPAGETFGDWFTVRSVKLFADGALGSRGAALLEPYADDPENRGILFYDVEELAKKIRESAEAGFQVNIHAIGDRANRTVLDAHERVRMGDGASLRHRVEHCQILHPADIPRFRKLQLIASVQPSHAAGDMGMVEERIGRERMEGAYAWRRLLKEGVRLAFGSDFPIESPDPFYGMHTAVNRQNEKGEPDGGWYPDQRVNRTDALRAYTMNAAFAASQESILGSLEPGKKADFILVDRDPFGNNSANLLNVNVLQTWVGGQKVYAID